jgi:hypothetical protein
VKKIVASQLGTSEITSQRVSYKNTITRDVVLRASIHNLVVYKTIRRRKGVKPN